MFELDVTVGNGRMCRRVLILAVVGFGVVGIAFARGDESGDLAANQAEFLGQGVGILVDVRSNVYSYKVTNLGTSSISSFEISTPTAISFTVPDGWEKEVASGIFSAGTDDPGKMVRPNKTIEFTVLASGRGPVLGRVPVKVGFESGEVTMVASVWSPIREPRSYVILVASVLAGIMLVHTVILSRRERNSKAAGSST